MGSDVKRMLLRPSECADAIGVSRSKMYGMLARDQLPFVRVEGLIRVPVDALQRWIADQAAEHAAEGGR